MKKLGDIFGVFPDSGTVPRAISEGTVKKVNILNEVRVVTLWADFPALIEREALFAAEKEYSKLLNASVCIKPRFPSELFSADYFPQLYTAVRREMPPEWVDAVMAFCKWLLAPAAELKKDGKGDGAR